MPENKLIIITNSIEQKMREIRNILIEREEQKKVFDKASNKYVSFIGEKKLRLLSPLSS